MQHRIDPALAPSIETLRRLFREPEALSADDIAARFAEDTTIGGVIARILTKDEAASDADLPS